MTFSVRKCSVEDHGGNIKEVYTCDAAATTDDINNVQQVCQNDGKLLGDTLTCAGRCSSIFYAKTAP